MISLQRRCKKHRQSQVFSIRAGPTFEKINPEVLFYGTSGRDFMLFGVLPDSNNFLTLNGRSGLPQPALMRRALWPMAILFCVTMTKKAAVYFRIPLILRNFAVIKL